KLEKIIDKNIPKLGEKMGTVIANILTPKMKERIRSWRSGNIDTLNKMNERIRSDCSESNLTNLLSSNSKYTETVKDWLRDQVGKDIAVELKGLCDKYGVRDISMDDLNIMALPKISIGDIPLDPLEFMDALSAVIAVIAGVISAASVTTIMAVIVVVISLISESLAATLFSLLVAVGPMGWGVLAVVVGVSVTVLMFQGFDSFKSSFERRVMGWKLPIFARETMTDEKINKSFSDANLPKQIEDAFKDVKLKEDIVKKVSANLKGQIEKRAEDIKYAIESK
ncbi:MAG TPA: hypothetical protein DCZ40_10985, partial [Lachnospiraceae bacterium]|nr:hypothetical protein [Lachnospiraceae bacterium]